MNGPGTIFAAALAVALALGLPSPAEGGEFVFTAGGDAEAGQKAAVGGKWSKSLTKAFKLVGAKLAEGGEMTVVLKVAEGDYDGDQGSGMFALPAFKNEKATLRLEGGYSADFSRRDPFGTPSRFVTVEGRTEPLVDFGKNWQDQLKALVWDGFVMDARGSNHYDAETGSLLKDGQGTVPMLAWGRLTTTSLVVQNSVFINAGRLAFDTDVWPPTADGVIRLYNDVFINCVGAVRMENAAFGEREKVSRMEIDHCSFLVNWADDLDLDRGNPCALAFSTCNTATRVSITNNLFFCNFGGAIKVSSGHPAAWVIKDNDFVGNGPLHGSAKADAAVMLVDEGVGRRNRAYALAALEDMEFVEVAEGNVSVAPWLPLSLASPGAVPVSGKESVDEEVARLLGRNLQGGKPVIKDYAPLKSYDPKNPPVPTNPEAKRYGASPERVGK